MAFPESVKLAVKRKSHFSCCICHERNIHVHHIIPQAEGGPDTFDNAAPLCPNCHDVLGNNPDKQKTIREQRDFWYEFCEQRFASDNERLDNIEAAIAGLATKDDIAAIADRLQGVGPDQSESNPGSPVAPVVFDERLSQVARYIVLGIGKEEVPPLITALCEPFGGEVMEGYPGTIECDVPVREFTFAAVADTAEVFKLLQGASAAMSGSEPDRDAAFFGALIKGLAPRMAQHIMRQALQKAAVDTGPIERFVVFGVTDELATWFELLVTMDRFGEQLEIDPESRVILFRDLAGLQAWLSTLQGVLATILDDRQAAIQIACENALSYMMARSLAQLAKSDDSDPE